MLKPTLLCATCLLAVAPAAAFAQQASSASQQASPTPQAAAIPQNWQAPADLSAWASGITTSGELEAGITGNPSNPGNGVNFGQLTTDKANRPILNQLTFAIERDTDPKATDYDWGFKLEGMYGSDSRIFHSIGIFDHAIHDRNQLDITEADISLHTPWLFSGGIDLKGGLYPSPLGYEVIDPKANQFYSHSYIFSVLPYKHLGLLAIAHVSDKLDLYLDVDTGSQTTIADADNNRRPAGIAGLNLTLLGGKLTILALTHIGPEDPKTTTPFADSAIRYYNDIVATYKYSDKLTFTTETMYTRETGYRAEAYGISQYAGYTLNDQFTLNFRAEVLRDEKNFFISTPVNNLDYVNAERGATPANFYTATRPTTYSEFTAGVTYKPAGMPKAVSTLLIRPEIRYDRTLNNSRPYDDGKDRGEITLAADIVLGF